MAVQQAVLAPKRQKDEVFDVESLHDLKRFGHAENLLTLARQRIILGRREDEVLHPDPSPN